MLHEGDNATSEFSCQLNEHKRDSAPEYNIEHYIDERAHVNVSDWERRAARTIWK